MSKTIKVATPIVIRYVGVFDWEGLYRMMQAFFTKKGWDFNEKKYKHKPWNYAGDEVEIEWESYKKITEYFKDWVYVSIYIIEFNKTGQKGPKGQDLYKGRLKITLQAELETDYADDFEKSKYWQLMRTFLNKWVLKKEIDFKHDSRLYYEVYGMHQKIKKFLKMYADYNAY